jgi:hypothetical protein
VSRPQPPRVEAPHLADAGRILKRELVLMAARGKEVNSELTRWASWLAISRQGAHSRQCGHPTAATSARVWRSAAGLAILRQSRVQDSGYPGWRREAWAVRRGFRHGIAEIFLCGIEPFAGLAS